MDDMEAALLPGFGGECDTDEVPNAFLVVFCQIMHTYAARPLPATQIQLTALPQRLNAVGRNV